MAGRARAWAAIEGAAGDREAGAAQIARLAAESLAALPRSDLAAATEALVRGHPSMAPLWRLATEVLAADDHATAAARFARLVAAQEAAVVGHARPLLDGPVVLHSFSSTVVAAVRASGGPALCAASQPGGEGIHAARRLVGNGIPAAVVEDEEARRLAAAGLTVAVGADAIGPGGVVNKVGTAALAESGRCVVVAGTSKLVGEDVPASAPFERTPLAAFAAIVTDRGVLAAAQAASAASRFPLHPDLRPRLRG